MLPTLALLAATAVAPVVSTEWLQAHLNDPDIRIIDASDSGQYERAHIPGARWIDHMATVGANHRLLPLDAIARAWSKLGVSDTSHVVLYGSSPMTTGWMYMTLAVIGHADQVSMLDGGIKLWEREKRATSKTAPKITDAPLSVKPAPDVVVDAPWVRSRLESPAVKILDVRTTQEWNDGHLPGATLILWPDLFADRETLKLKSPDDIRALVARAGVSGTQEVVTYCAVGMRASLMYWAARSVGIPARVYVGSWQDWRRDSSNPVIK